MRIIQSGFVLAIGLALSVLIGCQQGLTEKEVEDKIADKMKSLGLSESVVEESGEEAKPGQESRIQKILKSKEKTKSSKSPEQTEKSSSKTTVAGTGLSPKSSELASASLDIIKEISVLMANYKPELPEQVDNTSLMRCVTAEQRGDNTDLQRLWKSLEKERKASAKERKQTQREFFRSVYPINFRIDYDYKSRIPVKKREVTYGCYERGSWGGPQSSRSACINWCDDNSCWKLRSAGGFRETRDIIFFSKADRQTIRTRVKQANNADPKPESAESITLGLTPEPPEMMKRMKAAGVQAPERFYCVVKAAFTKGKKGTHWITCESPWEGEPKLRLSAPRTDVQRGDLVSVPLAGVKRPEGVLLKVHKRRKTYLWTVDVAASTLKIEEKTTACPDPKKVAAAVCRLADRKSDPMGVAHNCALAGDFKKLRDFAMQWHKKRIKNKNAVMITTTKTLMAATPGDIWAPFQNALYLIKENRGREAIASLRIVHEKSNNATEQLKVAEHARKAGNEALRESAIKKACALGMQAACGLLGTD